MINTSYSRYCTKAFPPYRFIPGKTPHPTEDPKGHSFGIEESKPPLLISKKWYDNEQYLYGVDLYNHAYWWESHEAFEGLWKQFPKGNLENMFLQGLIKISGAFLKWHLKRQRGLTELYTGGLEHLQHVNKIYEIYMGLNIIDHITKLSDHFRTVVASSDQWPDPLADYPFIILNK